MQRRGDRPGNRYIDADGVERGYYVYIHQGTVDGQVFYVGKGSERRAWDTSIRNNYWKAKVEELGDAWEVVILASDLSEIEAFENEEILVEKYGPPCYEGGPLTNAMPGDEDAQQLWLKVYCDNRTFKALPRQRQEEIALKLEEVLNSADERLNKLANMERADDELEDSVSDFQCFVRSLIQVGRDLFKRRCSWKDFALDYEALLDEELDDTEDYHPKVRPLVESVAPVVKQLFDEIDSGNRKEAEEKADNTENTRRD